MRGISPPKRLAGARTRPLCDPSIWQPLYQRYGELATVKFVKSDTIANLPEERHNNIDP